jgi:alkylation response protein AidB-like acyl-CoA dehydrogenase
VADAYRLGGVNDGWSVLRGPLDEEHSFGGDPTAQKLAELSIGRQFVYALQRALEAAVGWAVTPGEDGSRPADDPYVRYRLGQVEMDVQAALCTPGPMGRVKCSEALVHGAATLMDLVGPEALLSEGTQEALGHGHIDYAHRFAQGTATYGGTVEVFRAMIAQHVLGLPRPSYPGAKVLVQKKR